MKSRLWAATTATAPLVPCSSVSDFNCSVQLPGNASTNADIYIIIRHCRFLFLDCGVRTWTFLEYEGMFVLMRF